MLRNLIYKNNHKNNNIFITFADTKIAKNNTNETATDPNGKRVKELQFGQSDTIRCKKTEEVILIRRVKYKPMLNGWKK